MSSPTRAFIRLWDIAWFALAAVAVLLGLVAEYVDSNTWLGQALSPIGSKVAYVVLVLSVVILARRIEMLFTLPRFARRMRESWFSVPPDVGGIKPTPDHPKVFGVVMDWHERDVISTVIAFADGTSGVYTTKGLVLFGHHNAAEAARDLVRRAEGSIGCSIPAEAHPYPDADTVRFYLRTFDGLRLIEEKVSAVKNNTSEHSTLFTAANRIMTELFQQSRMLSTPPPTVGAA
jgi:hypothetical protein